MKKILISIFLMAITSVVNGQKTMTYSLKQKEAIHKAISSDKKVISELKKLPKAQRKTFLEKMSIFYALSKEDQQYVAKLCYDCLLKREVIFAKDGYDYQAQGMVQETAEYIGATIAGTYENMANAGAAAGKATGNVVGKLYDVLLGDNGSDSQGVVARPDGKDCEGRRHGFPF
ncbi:hypothetical protein [Flagellimonas onchidii]|uniref:hypothetical protein n=1 Tax=Flagellimonas onchidii TaxID=2562684 RepID=UPI0010A5D94D|nr:hypothetical protein [Allomuricauda onchidii]